MIGKKQRKTKSENDKTLTVIAQGAVVEGNIEDAGHIIIYGSFVGQISSSASLTVAPTGVVDATITSNQIYINGYVRGTLHTETLHLDSQARLIGEVHTSSLLITEGAVFHGSCSVPDHLLQSEGEELPLTRSASKSVNDPEPVQSQS